MTRFVKSFQHLLADLHQFDILQSGAAVGGVVPCPSWVKHSREVRRAARSLHPNEPTSSARPARHVRKVPTRETLTGSEL